jgi:hypothetical protein
MAWKHSLLAFRSFSGSCPAVGAGVTPEVLAALVDSDRWLPEPAAEVAAALDGCSAARYVRA